MTTTLTPPAVAARSRKLVAAAERTHLDPFTDVDWSVPIDDGAFHLPPEALPLFGTPAWEAMDDDARRTYSRHECASLCSAGIWFENILMQLLLDHLYDLPADDGAHRFLLLETADECRHSTMFGEYVRRAGTPDYLPHGALRLGGRAMLLTANAAAGYVAVLAAEELLDATNRATMRDERVHPIPRQMARLHVQEEARHVAFARTWLAEVWPTLGLLARLRATAQLPFVVRGIVDATVNPAVYAELDIPRGWLTARTNPRHHEHVVRSLARLTDLLVELGIINGATRPAWQALGLVGG